MIPERVLRFEVPSRDVLDDMVRAPLPLSLEEQSTDARFFRVVYFDTAAGDLENKGATVRLGIDDQGRQILSVDVRDRVTENDGVTRRHAESEVTATDPSVLFSGIVTTLLYPNQTLRAEHTMSDCQLWD